MDSNQHFNAYSLLLERTSKRIKQYAQTQFKLQKFGITVDQWIVLKKLNEVGGSSQSDLAELVNKDAPTLTRIIDLW
jgi:DNA-binding MarR family transcriptional regulator